MEIIGEAYRELQELVKRYAEEDLPVLFIGETGSGKELFMKLYIKESKRSGKKMTINCAALSDDLLRSEVFGHLKGAFTGAIQTRKGKIETCKNGILALDEIGDATPQFQAAILRISEANSYSPMGSDDEITTNTLIIGATNKPENLRNDLKERFHILPIPPLQKGDIPALASHFLKKSLNEETIEELSIRKYRGNIRELKKACERLKVEGGEKIFSKKTINKPSHHFDYNRFRREMTTWNRYIQPLIDYYGKEHKFEKYKYQYMPWDGDSLGWLLNRDKSLNPRLEKGITEDDDDFDAIYQASNLYDFLAYLKRSINEEDEFPLSDRQHFISVELTPEDCIKDFKDYMRYIFDCGMLPCLLAYIHLNAEIQRTGTVDTNEMPRLTYLLDLPLKHAEKEFVRQYYDYNVKKHPDTNELKAVVGMSKKSLDQKLKRNR